MRRFTIIACLAGTFLAVTASFVSAEDVSVTAKYQTVSGGYRYSLTLHNGTGAQSGMYLCMLYAQIWSSFGLEYPPVWDHTTTTTCAVTWQIADQVPSANWKEGIPSGGSLSGFNVTSPFLADSLYCMVDMYDGLQSQRWTGHAYPTLVPEPSALVALAGGLGALGLPLIRRRKAR